MTSLSPTASSASKAPDLKPVALWLFFVAGLVALLVAVGGLTRLTDSGLSITEWQPVTGALPPLGDAAWTEMFAKYQASSEYLNQNAGMSLAEFKRIFWWEWGHRLLGRLVGLAFGLPLLWFLVTRRVTGKRALWLIFLLVLGGGQGLVGWLMVASGLEDGMTDVSHYRLAAHLGLAVLIYGLLVWTAISYWQRNTMVHRRPGARLAGLFVIVVFAQICAGAFVAGLDAGVVYTTWPLIDGALIPPDIDWSRGGLDDRLTVQFVHRMLAYGAVVLAVLAWLRARRIAPAAASWLVTIVLAQTGLGIATLTSAAPLNHLWLAAAHQLGALALFTAAIVLLTQLRPSVA